MPQQWYNIQPDLPRPMPPYIHPVTHKLLGPEDMAPIFPMELIKQEVSQERWIDIPDEVRRIYRLWRPSPLHRARRLEAELKTPARIYYKNESVSPPGSHKPNTAVAQAYYNKQAGVRRLTTETGAGQWGSALSFACKCFDLECRVYMVKVSYFQKPYRRSLIHIWGAEVFPSPTDMTNSGRAILAKDPNSNGSLGIAISEAVEDAVQHEDTKYSLGSGGSNFAGFAFPFVPRKLKGEDIRIIAVEPTSCPTLTKGQYTYDFGDTAGLTPLIMMYTLGHSFIPPGIHAGGLRYHGDAPLLSLLVHDKIMEARAYPQTPVFESAITFARTEGIIPAPETAHCVHAAIDEALKCKATGEEKCIVIAFSGHGHFDLAAYDAYLGGKLEDYEYPDEKIHEAIAEIPKVRA
ncbi:MAG: TrpB-like pyridoxal phosphate-dependent enzyme [Deltaproteobacteria bacterium]|nr:TrpB-like pyridoxal phosphate-dependent enzyme [Deltaproteobacteria bacterium]